MECKIKTVINSVSDYGKKDVTFRLTTEELLVLKTMLVNSAHNVGYSDSNYVQDDLANVLLQALERINIKG